MKIRKATKNDIKTLQDLNDEIFVDNHKYDTDLNTDWAQSKTGEKYFVKSVRDSDSICLLAEDGNVAIGYIAAAPKDMFNIRNSRYIEIENMGVSPKYRSRGIGAQLMNECLKIAKKRGFDKVYVNSYFDNTKAIKFYKNNGFKEIDLCLERKI